MRVNVEVKDDMVLKFFDILNALKDEYVIDFNSDCEENIEDVEYEDETSGVSYKSSKERVFFNNR